MRNVIYFASRDAYGEYDLGFNPAPGYITDPERTEAYKKRQEELAWKRRLKENQ